jgi:nucleotide-binding universal stress UspA family protein
MRVVVWLTEGTWPACVRAARDLPCDEVTLLHVIDPETAEAVTGAQAGLLGRAVPHRVDAAVEDVLADGQDRLLRDAATLLGRPARLLGRRGRVEREVVAACAGTDLLVLARDGDHTRLGPRSLGHATRFVVDHAPCTLLLVWPDDPPALSTLPPPGSAHR